ncbi:hypothetical protein K8I61_18770 [bacterium]|nr:hypothetical protein [bacterium]
MTRYGHRVFTAAITGIVTFALMMFAAFLFSCGDDDDDCGDGKPIDKACTDDPQESPCTIDCDEKYQACLDQCSDEFPESSSSDDDPCYNIDGESAYLPSSPEHEPYCSCLNTCAETSHACYDDCGAFECYDMCVDGCCYS